MLGPAHSIVALRALRHEVYRGANEDVRVSKELRNSQLESFQFEALITLIRYYRVFLVSVLSIAASGGAPRQVYDAKWWIAPFTDRRPDSTKAKRNYELIARTLNEMRREREKNTEKNSSAHSVIKTL